MPDHVAQDETPVSVYTVSQAVTHASNQLDSQIAVRLSSRYERIPQCGTGLCIRNSLISGKPEAPICLALDGKHSWRLYQAGVVALVLGSTTRQNLASPRAVQE